MEMRRITFVLARLGHLMGFIFFLEFSEGKFQLEVQVALRTMELVSRHTSTSTQAKPFISVTYNSDPDDVATWHQSGFCFAVPSLRRSHLRAVTGAWGYSEIAKTK